MTPFQFNQQLECLCSMNRSENTDVKVIMQDVRRSRHSASLHYTPVQIAFLNLSEAESPPL